MPDSSCVGIGADWNPLQAAPAYSAFAAVLGGFVFACIVAIATNQARRPRPETLVLFLAAFLCLMCASYGEALISGDPHCIRGLTGSMFSSGMLGVGSASVFCGITWLLHSYIDTDPLVQQFSRWCAYAVVALVAILLAITVRGFLYEVRHSQVPDGWLGWLVQLYPPIVIAGLAAVVGVPKLSRRVRLHRLAAQASGRPDRTSAPDEFPRTPSDNVPLRIAGISTVVYVLINLMLMSMVADRPRDDWQPIPTSIIGIAAAAPILLAILPLLSLAYALPRPTSRIKDEREHHDPGHAMPPTSTQPRPDTQPAADLSDRQNPC